MREIKISKSDSGIRLDKLLFKLMPDAPSGVVYKSLRKKRVKVNGKRVTDGKALLNQGDVLELYINDEFFGESKPKSKSWENNGPANPQIIYIDENIAVLNKRSGLPSQDIEGQEGNSLESEFRRYLYKMGELKDGAYIPSLCHRIDRNTSGLVIAAKNIAAHRIITEKIKNKEIRKFYMCRVEGRLQPKTGVLEGYITKTAENRFRFTKEKTKDGKKSCLSYRVIGHEGNTTAVEVELLSGRTHQIRATMSSLGHPILGDVKYGAAPAGGEYQELTAYKLIFAFTTPAGELDYLKNKVIEI